MESILSDIEIGHAAHLLPIAEVAAAAGIAARRLEHYGAYIAKVTPEAAAAVRDQPRARYILVTAVTPTPLGEGRTATAIGLAQALSTLGHRAMLSLRQPSLGLASGVDGGATGAGYSQVVPTEPVNLHLTGDFHAVTCAHNLLAAMVDNHLHHGNDLDIDPRTIAWRRVQDVNDRSLATMVSGLHTRTDGAAAQAGFEITAASEVMAILSLAASLRDLRRRLGRIVVGYTYAGTSITAEDLKAAGAMTVIMRDAVKPNLLQTLEHTPALIHAGPLGTTATGASSVVADLLGVRTADYLITEADFGADMGAERFFNVKCRASGLSPDGAVLVVTVRALKTHSGRYQVEAGGLPPAAMLEERPQDVRLGAANLLRHIEILRRFGVSPVVAINAFPTDYESELEVIRQVAAQAGVKVAVTHHVADGGKGALDLAGLVVEAANTPTSFHYLYDLSAPLAEKIELVAREIYGADGIDLSPLVVKQLRQFDSLGYGKLPVVIAKTHLSLSSDPTLLGAPTGWRLPILEIRAAVGAGYVEAICSELPTMPGLPKHPAAECVDIDEDDNIVGLS